MICVGGSFGVTARAQKLFEAAPQEPPNGRVAKLPGSALRWPSCEFSVSNQRKNVVRACFR